jgi:vanillate O-demethylase ferredoxin subunit
MVSSMITVRVARKATEAVDICSFELVHPGGEPLPAFGAGSHIDVHGPTGLARQYSLCNDPTESHRYLIAVLQDPNSRGGSIAMHDGLKEGDLLQISEPKNHFALAAGAEHSLLLAGGIGITPILCMAERLSNLDASFELHYCTRSKPRTAFVDRIQASAPLSAKTRFHFDDSAPEQKLDLVAALAEPQPGKHLYVCGPTGFLDFVLTTARKSGWAEECIHFEYFGAAVAKESGDRAFQVKIASTGKICDVPAGTSVLHALAAVGVEIPYSCEQGVCGTCLTHVLQGEPDHRDHFLNAAERAANDQFTPCCSRSSTPMLVLDL